MIRAWTVVYSANVVGCLLSAYFLAYTPGLFAAEPYVSGVQKIAIGKTSGKTFFQTFLLGVGSNWLVNLACYMAIASKTVSSKIIALWLPVMVEFILKNLSNALRHLRLLDLNMVLPTLSLYLLEYCMARTYLYGSW